MSKRRIAMVWVGLLAGGLASQARAADEPPVPAAEAAYRTGDPETAIRLWEKSLPRLEAGEALEVRARVANARRKLGELDAAARALGPLLEAAIARKDAPREALVRHYRGRLALDLGRPAEAAVDLRVALALYRRLGDARNVSALSTALAGSEYLAGHVDTAYAEYDAILEAARQARDLRGEGDALVGLGGCLSTIQEHRMAASLFVQAAEVLSGAGFADRADLAHLEAAQSLLWAGRPAEAQALVERASRGAGQSADIRARLTLLAAQMDLRRGDAERAMGWLEAELKAQPAGRSGRLEAALWIARAAILLKVARWAEADAALKALEAMTLAPMDQSELDTMRGFRLLRTGKAAEALAPLRRAAAKEDALWRAFDPETLTGMADAAILPRAGALLAEAELRAGTPEDALEAVARAQARATALAIQADPGPAGETPESMTERVKRRVRLHTRLVAASSVPNAAALRASPRVAAGQVALLDFHLLPDRVDMLWVDAGGVRHRHVDVDAATLEAEVRMLAAAVERPTGVWQAASRTLGERLLGPWRAELKAAEKAGGPARARAARCPSPHAVRRAAAGRPPAGRSGRRVLPAQRRAAGAPRGDDRLARRPDPRRRGRARRRSNAARGAHGADLSGPTLRRPGTPRAGCHDAGAVGRGRGRGRDPHRRARPPRRRRSPRAPRADARRGGRWSPDPRAHRGPETRRAAGRAGGL